MKDRTHQDVAALERAEDLFILEWERMSSSWGINRTMAQIHALLFITGRPMDVNDIILRLGISRGNASMNLRELLDWGIVRRWRRPGDRKDLYISEADPWQMFVRVVRERKRREIDPTMDAIKEVISKLPNEKTEQVAIMRTRLESLMEIFDLIDVAYKQVFSSDETLTQFRQLLKSEPI
ncbi:MAG: MarR family transcriptional regulator [Armatimonadetes bacterium]|nr:MarR family transcriptional regulator [Armatimonadota bacterium]